MANIHMVLQGKGGVGKTVIAALLAQYMHDKGETPLCVDSDPINATFEGYKALTVRRLEIMDDEDIDARSFDLLIEWIASAEADVIVDNGAASFVALAHYLKSNGVAEILDEMGHSLVMHTVVTGGQACLDTLHGFGQLAANFPPPARIVVWLNPYWGPIEVEGRQFEDMKVYKDLRDRVSALIYIPELKAQTHGRDLAELLQERKTFREALESEGYPVMVRHRLKTIRDRIFERLDSAGVLG